MTQVSQDEHCFVLAPKPQNTNQLSSAAAAIFAFRLGCWKGKRLAAADVRTSPNRVSVSHFTREFTVGLGCEQQLWVRPYILWAALLFRAKNGSRQCIRE